MAIRSDSAGLEKQYLLDMLARESGCILEVGCGDGRLTRHYADSAGRVFAIDLPASLPSADAKALPASISLAAASGIRLPFPARRFDQAIFALSF